MFLINVPLGLAGLIFAWRLIDGRPSEAPPRLDVAGVLLTGTYELAGPIGGLVGQAPFPILRTAMRTYAAATAVHAIDPVVTAEDEAKIATAIGGEA